MDWTGCDLVEVVPGKVSGVPLIRGTRIPADIVVTSFESGSDIEEIHENYPGASVETIQSLLSFASVSRLRAAS